MKVSLLFKNLNTLLKYSKYKRFVSSPSQAAFEITNRCTSECEYCVSHGDKEDYLSTDDALSIINKLKGLGIETLSFTGGEPLLRKDIFTLLRHAESLDIRTIINTNGMICKESIFRNLFQAGLDALTFSLDGVTAETHEAFRRKTSFDLLLESIRTAVALRNKHKYKTRILTNTVITKRNVSDLEAIAHLAKSLGVDRNHFQLVWKPKSFNNGEMPKPFISDADFKSKFGFADPDIRLLKQASDTIQRIPNSIPKKFIGMFQDFYMHSKKVKELECFAGRAFIYVDKKGDLYPCGLYPSQFGSILHENPSALLKTKEAKTIMRKASKQQCGGCAFAIYMERNLMLNEDIRFSRLFRILANR